MMLDSSRQFVTIRSEVISMLNNMTKQEWLAGWEIGKRRANRMTPRLIHLALRSAQSDTPFGQGYVAALSVAVGL